MAIWEETANDIQFAFATPLQMCFTSEEDARKVSDLLREEMEIETKIVEIVK